MSKNIDDINRKIRDDNERARNMDQLCVEGDIHEMRDPKPTNAQRLAALLGHWPGQTSGLACYLDKNGVKAPEGDRDGR